MVETICLVGTILIILKTNFMECTPETFASHYLGANKDFAAEGWCVNHHLFPLFPEC